MINNKKMLKFFLRYQKPHLKTGVIIGCLLLLNVLLRLPMPLVARFMIDKVIISKDFKTLNFLSIGLFFFILFSQITRYIARVMLAKYKASIRYEMENDLYLHIQKLPMNYFSDKKTGYIMERMSELSSADILMVETIVDIIKNVLTFLTGLILLLKLHLLIGIISVSVLPFFIYAIKKFHKKLKYVNMELYEAGANYQGKLECNINSIERIKTKVKEIKEGERFSRKLKVYLNKEVKSEKISIIASIVASFIGVIAPFIVLWFGISEIIKGNLTLGSYFAINAFLGYLYGPAQNLTGISYRISQAMAGLERVYELFDLKEEESGNTEISEIKDIVYKNVDFSYTKDKPVLNKINLTIRKGEKIAIVGKSGEGKSTILKLLLKLYLPQAGNIYVSGINIEKVINQSIRSKICYISQNSTILEEDVEELISSGEIKKTLIKFNLNPNIKRILQKRLSGGEVQRIDLAEVLVNKKDLLLLDEATASLDYKSEKIVLKAIFEQYKNKTVIFVAHRLTSVMNFERIIVIDKGRVVEEGSHRQLLKKKGVYYSLWRNVRKMKYNNKKEKRIAV